MRESLIKKLRCPKCCSNNFNIKADLLSNQEIKEGEIICQICQQKYTISDGLLFLYNKLSPAAEIEILATRKENESKKNLSEREKRMENLSHTNALDFLSTQKINNKNILELGAYNGWLTASLAVNNYCVATDIYYELPTGLKAAEKYFNDNSVFFERVVADMVSLPFSDKSFDVVLVCAALHHSSNLKTTLKEIERILKDDGRLIMVSEPSTGLLGTKERLELDHDLKNGFNEGRYSIFGWLRYIKQAGFKSRLFLPENMFDILKSRNYILPAKLWGSFFVKVIFLKLILTYLILTIFDGFFNIVAIKQDKD